MWKVKFLAVVLLLLVFVLEAESLWGRGGRRRSPPCSPRACKVSSWSTWSPCTHQCGTSGKQKKIRTVTVAAACGGSCPHLSETRSCNRNNCQNSGTPTSKGCSCLPGYSGTCCEIGELNTNYPREQNRNKKRNTCKIDDGLDWGTSLLRQIFQKKQTENELTTKLNYSLGIFLFKAYSHFASIVFKCNF